MIGLTKRQRLVLDIIATSLKAYGYPPTLREIGAAMGINSTNGVNDHLIALGRKGYIERDDLRSRGVRLTDLGAQVVGMPSLAKTAEPSRDEFAERVRAALNEPDDMVDPAQAAAVLAAWVRAASPRKAARILTIVRAALGMKVAARAAA